MSFNINSDKEFIRGGAPKLVGDNELTIRGGTGSSEREILRTQLDEVTGLPRVGINRTGQRVNNITILTPGSGYSTAPSVNIGPPNVAGGIQALASAFIFNGQVVNIAINNPGSGYTTAPSVSITSEQGFGATAESALDTVDFELDINGAIRTSTSIISDTARILNLDIDNFITPDANFRAPYLKNFMNNTGIPWDGNVIIQENSYRYFGANLYQALNTGKTDPNDAPTHIDGVELNGEVQFRHVGFRVQDENSFAYNQTGDDGIFPRSVTPLLGDRSNKIATTEYVLNLATNDVGGRIYVSQQIGSDENDGRSAVNPVRTIKKAAQLAWTTPGVKETIIVSGGDYVEDNPISLPPDASVVGDNLRLVIVRPGNPGKHIFKFGDKNYVIGVTYRDKVDSIGDPVSTWDFAMVFDDKQRIIIDQDTNGDAGVNFPVGHQIFGPDQFRVRFQENTGLSNLQTGQEVIGLNTGSRAQIIGVEFDQTVGVGSYLTGTLDVTLTSGSFLEGESFNYIVAGTAGSDLGLTVTETTGEMQLKLTDDPSSDIPPGTYVYLDDTDDIDFTTGFYEVKEIIDDDAPSYWLVNFVPILDSPTWDSTRTANIDLLSANIVVERIDTTSLKSIRAEGEVVEVNEDIVSELPIVRLDFSLQGDPSITQNGFQNEQFGNAEDIGGVIFYTNELVGRDNFHEFKEGEEIVIEGLPTNAPDLSALNGKQRIYKVLYDADGRARRFVIPKKYPGVTNANFDPGQNAIVKSYSKSITLSLLNSPNTFPLSTPVERRYQDASQLLRNNRDFIADEVVGRINNEFSKDYYAVYDIGGTPTNQFTPSNADYDPVSGLLTFTVTGHGLDIGDGIRVADDSIVFVCAMDGYRTEHSNPQIHHYSRGKSLPILSKTNDTFTVYVGKTKTNQEFTPSNATYDPSTGIMELTVGTHGLAVGEGVVFEPNSLSFTCNMDGNSSVKTYPRVGIDPYAQRSVPLTAVTDTTISMNIGIPRDDVYFTPTDAVYTPSTGEMVLTIGQHGLGVGRNIVINNNALTFTCTKDGNATQHTYPRSTDPASNKSLDILAVGHTTHTPTDAVYDAATGVIEITVSNHGFANGDYVKLDDDALTYTCDLNGNADNHSYPRAGMDKSSGRWFAINNRTANTFEINVGTSSYTGNHTFVSAVADSLQRQTGTITVNVGASAPGDQYPHTFVTGAAGSIKHLPQQTHTFAGATNGAVKHLPQSAHQFRRAATNALSTGGSDFKIYLGPTTDAHTYVSGGTVDFGGQQFNITNFVYDHIAGFATITTSAPVPNLAEDSVVKIADIVVSCPQGQKKYPAFNIRLGDDQCRQDVVHFLNALVRDLEFGSNFNIIEGAEKYIVGAKIGFVENEIIQTVRAVEYTRQLAITCMRNWRTGNGTPSDPIYTPVFSSLPRYFDDTIITSTATNAQGIACDDVRAAIDTLSFLWVDVLANNSSGTYLDAAYLIARNKDAIAEQALADTESRYPTLNLNDVDQRKCRRDIRLILGALIRDLVLGGNSGIVTNAELYYTGAALTGIDSGFLPQTRYAFERVEYYAKAAMRNWSSGDVVQTTPSFASYDSSNGNITVSFPDPTQSITTNDKIAFQEGGLTFTCDQDSDATEHAYPRESDPYYGKSIDIVSVSSNSGVTTVTCNVGIAGTAAGSTHSFVSAATNKTLIIYNPVELNTPIPKFEDWNILTDSSGSAAIAIHTPTNATYNPANGDFVVTVENHGLTTSNTIRIAPESFTFTCAMDGNKTEHYLPGIGQQAYGNSLQITGTTQNTYTVNVGASGPDQQWTPSDATYNPTTGILELTLGEDHGLNPGVGIIIEPNSLTFTCDMDNNDSQKTYPRPGIDPYGSRSIPVSSVTETTASVNIGIAPPNRYFTPVWANYKANTGELDFYLGQHGLGVGRNIVIENDSLTFSCDQDGYATDHTYPRAGTDPQAGKSIAISAVEKSLHTPTDAPYDAATGEITFTVANHGFSNGDYVLIEDDSLTYACALGGSGVHTYVGGVVSNAVISGGNYTHTFVSAVANGVTSNSGNLPNAVTNVVYTPSSGEMVITSNSHGLSTSNTLQIANNALSFRCTMDGNGEIKTYPRPSDPASGSNLTISAVTQNTITVNVGASNLVNHNVSNATYDPESGELVLTIGTHSLTAEETFTAASGTAYNPTTGIMSITSNNHGLVVGDKVKLEDGAVTFSCAYGAGTHNYVGGVVDGLGIILDQNGIPYDVSDADYTPTTGALQISLKKTDNTAHGLTTSDTIQIRNESLKFTCTADNNNSTHAYPRETDPFAGKQITIDSVNTDTITVNVGVSSPGTSYPRSSDPISGEWIEVLAVTQNTFNIQVLDSTPSTNTDVHTFVSGKANAIRKAGTAVRLAPDSLAFTCDKDKNNTIHTYPRATDPAYNTSLDIIAATGTTITLNVGKASAGSSYPRAGFDYISGRWIPISGVTTNTFKINTGNSSYTGGHSFVSASANAIQRQTGWITVNVGVGGAASGSLHFFKGASPNAIKFEPRAAHTFVGASSNAVKHLPQAGHTFVRTKNESISVYGAGSAPLCAGVESSISTEMEILDGVLEYAANPESTSAIEPGSITKNYGTLYDVSELRTYPDNFIYDQNNTRMAIRGFYDDYPIIEASPYTQNASVISFLGGGGALIDGSKVKQPNCPFPGLELDGTASFPNQGKSMVASAFTIVSFGGTGYKVINDGYTQLVSVFVIFCQDGVLAESGGYCSITNSATNFGTYALRGVGYRAECYSFDQGTISNVSATPTGRTILTVSGLGREPLEHYVGKIDGYRNTNTNIEYFIDVVAGVTVGPPFSAQLTFDDGTGQGMDLTDLNTGNPVSTGVLLGKTIKLHRPSIVNSSSHTWEFAGSGTNYLALPENGGTKIEAYEQVSELYGRVYVSGTDELGDFKVGTFARIENRTGAITFTGTVTISEVEFLKLKGGDVVVTGFDASNTLGGANSSDSKLPTQKAVRDYITNSLGPYINKPYSTNAVPRALVELTDSGKISVDQIPALRPFEVYTVANQTERLAIEGALAGDIAIEQDTSTSFILNNDLDSQFLSFSVDTSLQFTLGDIFTGSVSGGRLQATEYRQGVVYSITISDGGSGYATPPTITLTGGNPQSGSVEAKAECVIANGEVVAIDIIAFNGFKGGKGYTIPPTVNISAPQGSGTQASGNALIESRLYGDIVNRIKIEDTDQFDSSDVPSVTIDVDRAVNTSSSDANNWVSLSSNQIAATDIVSGVIESDRLASGGAANSFTFLRGDQNFALAVQSIKGAEKRYFAKLTQNFNSGSSEMVFATLPEALVGHEILNNIVGIQPNTNITGVLTTGGSTTISVNNPATASISAGTVVEFERGESPIIFDSTYTQGNFVDSIVISNGGTGFTNGQYFDLDLTGGTGTGLKCNLVITGGSIVELTVTDGGTGFDADFNITQAPNEIGAGSGLVLLAKVSTVNRQYANVAVDVQRVSDLTISSDLYGTIGVARFKKSQFTIGVSGNGSVDLNVGADSGLDADLLDGAQGAFYLNSGNQNAGTLPQDRLSGSYNISVSGSAGNALRLETGTNNPTSNPSPDNFVGGIVANTVNNSSNQLDDGGAKNLVMTVRSGGTSFDASFGGVRQLAFTDNDNMWLRGSGTGVTSFGSWALMWNSLNDGIGSGLDADKLDNRQGTWYQNALNINYGVLSDNRLPDWIDQTAFKDKIEVRSYNGDTRYKVYISGLILNATPFTPGNTVNLYNANGQGTGVIEIDNIVINNDTQDNANDYTIIIGRLTTGNFVGAETIGTASDRKEFQDFTIDIGNTIPVATLESDGSTANLRLGRKDGIASSPGIYFSSSALTANYNAAIVASGGTATDGSGSLNVQVENADAFTANGSVIWNAGNIEFQTANIADTAVKRDGSGGFSAGTITLDVAGGAELIGAASLNVLKEGDTMTGGLTIGTGSAATQGLSVSGEVDFLNTVDISGDLNVDSGTLFVDVSNNNVGLNTGTTLVAGLTLDIQGGTVGALRLQGHDTNNNHFLYFDGGKSEYFDDANHAMMFLSSGQAVSTHPGEGAHWIFNGRASNRDFIFRTNSQNVLTIQGDGGIFIENSGTNDAISADNNIVTDAVFVSGDGSDNAGAGLTLLGAAGFRNYRVGSNFVADNMFAVEYSSGVGGNSFGGGTIIAGEYDGSNARVGINTTTFQGNDPEANNQLREYILNVGGDMNINGQLFQNNSEFVTSRWTESPNGNDIYRASKVGIGFTTDKDPGYALDVEGDFNVVGTTYIGGVRQYQDSQGIIKAFNDTILYDVDLEDNSKSYSNGPIYVASGVDIVFGNNASWTIL